MRRPIIFGNWKMNKTRKEAKKFVKEIELILTGEEKAEYGVAVPFTLIDKAVDKAKNLLISAQNCHFEDSGAYTGEVSVPMLKDVKVTHCVIGHSERRMMFADTDETVNKKAKKLIENGIVPIVCIGESEAQYDNGETESVIRSQLNGSLAGLDPKAVENIVVAYEPIWAIGTGKSATKEIAQDCCAIVRDEIKNMFGEDAANKVRIQYGGSVKPDNIAEYMACEDIDGALIGGASLQVDSFTAIINATK
ncbi:MAG TPA: triose-phosphate isomerase [Erysipelotrichaceae bacterium]|nr:triose-phosphate isomerase [Erysipelotrichaceae bacterium]HCY05828.1 triose-phosphate isomerase [Erysipelotrichaceae bacterium]